MSKAMRNGSNNLGTWVILAFLIHGTNSLAVACYSSSLKSVKNGRDGCLSSRRWPIDKNNRINVHQRPILLMQGGFQEEHANYNWTQPTIEIAVPALIGMIADPFLSLVDTFFTGKLGPVALAALGPCTSIFHLFFNAFQATTLATTSLVATALAKASHHSEAAVEVQSVTSSSLKFSVSIGLGLFGILWIFAHPILSAMGVQPSSSLSPYAASYLRYRSIAAPFVLFCTVSAGAFRGYGDTKIPTIASLLAGALNCILDPILMFAFGMHLKGAALATAISQILAAYLYYFFLRDRNMLLTKDTPIPHPTDKNVISPNTHPNVIATIIKANLAMITKQGSLLLAWAYATARATRIGPAHVAAHQVSLSTWLFLALVLDGAAVAAQVLASSSLEYFEKTRHLTVYMSKLALAQGVAASTLIFGLRNVIPRTFTTDPEIQSYLMNLMPILSFQQTLVSLTLVLEGLVLGSNNFRLLAYGTTISTLLSIIVLRKVETIVHIWKYGIVSLFAGRLLTAVIGVVHLNSKKRFIREMDDL